MTLDGCGPRLQPATGNEYWVYKVRSGAASGNARLYSVHNVYRGEPDNVFAPQKIFRLSEKPAVVSRKSLILG